MKIRLALATAALAASIPASAQDIASGWYGTLSGGQSRTDDSLVGNREGTIHNATSFRTEFEATDTAWRAALGWKFHPNFAAEANYTSYGRTTMDTRFVVPIGQTQAGRVYTDRKVEGFGADLVATWPVLEHFALLGRVGWLRAQTEATVQLSGDVIFSDGTPGNVRTNKLHEDLLKFGAGLEWLFAKDFALRIEWERLPDAGKALESGVSGRTGEADVDAVMVGLAWRFR